MMLRRLLFVMFILCTLLLYGCSLPNDPIPPAEEDNASTATTEATAPEAVPNLIDTGMPWDREGVLTEIFLTLPGAWRYHEVMVWDDLFLLYGRDSHLEQTNFIHLALVDPLTGEIHGTKTYSSEHYITPQIYKDRLYLIDATTGNIAEYDKQLHDTHNWTVEPYDGESFWFVGEGQILYQVNADSITTYNLTNGERRTIFEQPVGVGETFPDGNVGLVFYNNETGIRQYGILDLATGEIIVPESYGVYMSASRVNDKWLYQLESLPQTYHFIKQGLPYRISTEDHTLQLLQEDRLLVVERYPSILKLYDTDGRFLSACTLSHEEYDLKTTPLWREDAGGYFLVSSSYYQGLRFLFWDVEKQTAGEDLHMELLPEEGEAMSTLRSRADALEQTYGVSIFIGEECRTSFYDFEADIITDYEYISGGLDTLDRALRNYPTGFFSQIKYGSVQGIRIYLVQNVRATDEERHGGSYNAFVNEDWDHCYMVMDITQTNEHSYYHEISHVIDRYLQWDSSNREGALYSEEAWNSLNPDSFTYAYSYGEEYYNFDYGLYGSSFIDGYSTTYPTEDRARVMEYSMMPYSDHYFYEGSGLYEKLAYYSRCIRDAFDTVHWEEELLWEQYLS